MEKISCNVIGDLLPLYCDDVCSQDSRRIVEEHLRDCPECAALYEKMKQEYSFASGAEQKQEEMVKDMAARWHRSVKKSFCRGALLTLCACLVLAGGYLALTRLVLIPVPPDIVQAVVGNVSDTHVEVSLTVDDGKKVSSTSLEFTEDGKCFILLKRGVIPQGNGSEEAWTGEWAVSRTGITESGERVPLREIYCGTQADSFLIWQAE